MNLIDWNEFDYTEPYYGEYTIQISKAKKRRIVYKAFRLEKDGMPQLVPMVYCIITNHFEKSPKHLCFLVNNPLKIIGFSTL